MTTTTLTAKELESQKVIMELRKVEIGKMAQLIRVHELRQEIQRIEDSMAVSDRRLAELRKQLTDSGVQPPDPMPMPA